MPAENNCAVLHAKPVLRGAGSDTVITPFYNVWRLDAHDAVFNVNLGVELDYVENSVLARIDELIGLSVYKRTAVKEWELSAEREAVLPAEFVHDRAVEQIDNKDVRWAFVAVIAGAEIENGIAARVKRSGAFESETEVEVITRLVACGKV